MMVLNTTPQDNDSFYGKVYATGSARISGDKGLVKMDIAATTDDRSSFFMPLSSKSNISSADFVTFREPARVDTVDNLARKKMMFERKRQQKSDAGSRMDISLALNVRPGVEVELTVSGNTLRARGDGTLNLQINPRSNVFEIVRRLYHHRGELPLLAAEHHQQEVRHRGWLHNPVDGLADGCHAQHQRHLQAQGVVAAPVAGYVRQPRG